MADRKISELTQITGANVDDANDEIAIVDTSASETKAITRAELFSGVASGSFDGDVTVGGNLTVNGTTVTIDTTTLDVADKNITIAKDAPDAATADGAGLTVDGANATITYDSTDDTWDFNKGISTTGDIEVTGTVDGRDVAADGSKLDGIESNATADQTASEIKTAYESNADTNAFTDAEQTKLSNVESNADVTDTANVTAAGALMDSELTSEASVKALDQGVATTDSPDFAGLSVDTDTLFVDASTDSVGINNASPSASLDVTGDAKVSGDLTVDTDTLYVDSANNRVGIGTSSPDKALYVMSGTNNTDVARFTGGVTSRGLVISTGLSFGTNDCRVDLDAVGASGSFGIISFSTNSSEAMRIDSSGDLVYANGNQAYSHRGEERVNAGTTVTFFDLYTNPEGRGFYLVTASRNEGSVAVRSVAIVASSSSTSSIVYNVIDSNGLTIGTSGSNLTITNDGASNIDIHCSAVPLSLNKDA